MADGLTIPATGSKVATDDTGAPGHVQLFKLAYSADGVATLVGVDVNGLDVDVVRVADGADVALGATADASTANTVIGRLKKLLSVIPAALGQAAMSASTPVVIASDQTTLNVASLSMIPGTGATNLGKAEDAAHATGDVGVMALGVRNDSGSALASATGDYVPLSTDAAGALRVTGGGGGTEYTEDIAAATDPVGNITLARRRDTLTAAEVSADGDNVAINATSKGQMHVAAQQLPAALGQTTKAASLPVALASDSDPLNVTGSITVSGQSPSGLASDALYLGSTAVTPKFAKIDRATSADGAAVVNLVSAKKIRVIRLSLVCAGAVGIKWQSSTSNTTGAGTNTDLCPVMSYAANGGISDGFCPVGLIETLAGEALKLNLNAAVQVSGYLTYIEV